MKLLVITVAILLISFAQSFETFDKNCQVLKGAYHCRELTITELVDGVISNASKVIFENSKLGLVNGSFFNKFPIAKKIEFINCELELSAAQSADNVNLQELSFTNCRLLSIVPKAFDNLQKLKKLDLSNNALQSVPDVSTLKSLISITLDNNQIAEIHAELLPKTLFTLNARNNQIHDVNFAGITELRAIYLTNNKLSKVKKASLENLAHLEYIGFDHNEITDIEEGSFYGKIFVLNLSHNKLSKFSGESMINLSGLARLQIDNNQITEVDETNFDGLEKVKFMDIQNNQISKFSHVLAKITKTQFKLTATNNPFEGEELEKLKASDRIKFVF